MLKQISVTINANYKNKTKRNGQTALNKTETANQPINLSPAPMQAGSYGIVFKGGFRAITPLHLAEPLDKIPELLNRARELLKAKNYDDAYETLRVIPANQRTSEVWSLLADAAEKHSDPQRQKFVSFLRTQAKNSRTGEERERLIPPLSL